MPQPSFLPVGDQFYATIRRPGLEEVIQVDGVSLKFPSAAAATLHARNEIKREIEAAKPPPPPPDPAVQVLADWKREKADQYRAEREAFEMRTIAVVTKKRRVRK